MLGDIRQAVRTMLKRPGFTVVAVLTLALGIGANSTVFTFLNAALLEAIPLKDFDRTVFIWSSNPQLMGDRLDVSLSDFNAWKSGTQSFDELAAFGQVGFTATGNGDPERIQATEVTANFFDLLESAPEIGRGFLTEEQQVGVDRVALLSHGFWQRRFGGDPGILGRTIVLDGEPREIIGVMPRKFWFPRQETSIWIPIPLNEKRPRDRRSLWVFGRLGQNASLEQARSEMAGITNGLAQAFPETNAGWAANVVPLGEALLKPADRAVGLVLVMTVMFVLLIACVNVTNLLLSRAIGREKEMAIRAALGARRIRLTAQLLIESLVLALAGGFAGLLIALWCGEILMRFIPHRAPTPDTLIDLRVFGLTMLLSVVSSMVFGIMPALRLSRTDVNTALKEVTRGVSDGPHAGRLRTALIVAEVALTLVLMVGAGLVLRQTMHLQSLNPGFDRDRLLTFALDPPPAQYNSKESIKRFYSSVQQRLSALPGIESAAATSDLPLESDGQSVRFSVEGAEALAADEKPLGFQVAVSPDYFRTLGIPILRGRNFVSDDGSGSPLVAVISEALADRHFAQNDPVGQRLEVGGQLLRIVGVTTNVMPDDLRSAAKAHIYVPYDQMPVHAASILLRTEADPMAAIAAVRAVIWSIDRDLPVDRLQTMNTLFDNSFRGGRIVAGLLGVFAALALTLSVIGIYGVVSYSAKQQTHEIGIRLALGATHGEVRRMVVGRGLIPVSLGVAIGLIGSLAVGRILAGVLVGISPSDPVTYITVTSLLSGVAILASYLPAWRASRVDPMVAVRHE